MTTSQSNDKILLKSSSGEIEILNAKIGGESLDPVYKGTQINLSNEDRTVHIIGLSSTAVGIKPINSGKWYWEVKINDGNYVLIGITKDGENLSQITYNTGNSRYYYSLNGYKWSTNGVSYGNSYAVNDVISVLLDMDEGKIEFWVNGVSQGVAFDNLLTLVSVRPSVTRGSSSGSSTVTFRLTKDEFTYNMPEGYTEYGVNKGQIISLSSVSEQNYADYGMSLDDLKLTDMSIDFNEKHYVQDVSNALDSGKIYKHNINLSKRKIKKIKCT